ncbi:transposase [Streptomyces sp. NPDC059466]|uniref:transposase n=1 Tax=unclassified Streptomyces TaxID=2593676 RepID=UPI0036C4E837
MRARLAWKAAAAIKLIALIIIGAGFLVDGDASACVLRQGTGTAGKVITCQAGVSRHLPSVTASAAIVWRLFLPSSWEPASS